MYSYQVVQEIAFRKHSGGIRRKMDIMIGYEKLSQLEESAEIVSSQAYKMRGGGQWVKLHGKFFDHILYILEKRSLKYRDTSFLDRKEQLHLLFQ